MTGGNCSGAVQGSASGLCGARAVLVGYDGGPSDHRRGQVIRGAWRLRRACEPGPLLIVEDAIVGLAVDSRFIVTSPVGASG
jgi:hypothetical protein